jgi:hypothetical protein
MAYWSAPNARVPEIAAVRGLNSRLIQLVSANAPTISMIKQHYFGVWSTAQTADQGKVRFFEGLP